MIVEPPDLREFEALWQRRSAERTLAPRLSAPLLAEVLAAAGLPAPRGLCQRARRADVLLDGDAIDVDEWLAGRARLDELAGDH